MQQSDTQYPEPEYLAYSVLTLAQEVAAMSDEDFRGARDMAEQAKLLMEHRIKKYDEHQDAA